MLCVFGLLGFVGKDNFFLRKTMFLVIFLVSVAFVVRGELLVPDEEQEGKFFNVKTFNLVVLFSAQNMTRRSNVKMNRCQYLR